MIQSIALPGTAALSERLRVVAPTIKGRSVLLVDSRFCYWAVHLMLRGREDGHPAGLITRRSLVRVQPPLPFLRCRSPDGAPVDLTDSAAGAWIDSGTPRRY